jgi:hypothetical protein
LNYLSYKEKIRYINKKRNHKRNILRTNHYKRSIMNKTLLWPRRTGREALHLARGEIGTAPSPMPAYLGAVLQPFVQLEHTMGLSTCASQSCWCIMCSMGDPGFPMVRGDCHFSSSESVSRQVHVFQRPGPPRYGISIPRALNRCRSLGYGFMIRS